MNREQHSFRRTSDPPGRSASWNKRTNPPTHPKPVGWPRNRFRSTNPPWPPYQDFSQARFGSDELDSVRLSSAGFWEAPETSGKQVVGGTWHPLRQLVPSCQLITKQTFLLNWNVKYHILDGESNQSLVGRVWKKLGQHYYISNRPTKWLSSQVLRYESLFCSVKNKKPTCLEPIDRRVG